MNMMRQSSFSLLLLLLVLFLYSTPTLISCTESEVQALLAWRSSLKYPGNLTKMWSYDVSPDPCHWDGIKCNHADSITELSYDGLMMSLAPRCDYLTVWSYNAYLDPCHWSDSIHGTLAKFNFSSFPNLISLQITHNQNLHGKIPEEIGKLHNLETLDLSSNNLNGRIPRAILNLSNLSWIDLGENELTGEIPREILKLSNLLDLRLDNNKFTGEIPNVIGHSSQLIELDLSGNRLRGHIPEEIGNLTALWSVDLSHNKLQGKVPSTISQLSNLCTLYLNDNQLTDSIIPYLGNNNSNFYDVNLSNNNFTGAVPSSICEGGNLQHFLASNNNFDELLSNTFQNCTPLATIDLGSNIIKADISHVFGENPNLIFVDFSHNRFYGELSCNSTGLTTSPENFHEGFSIMTQLEGFIMNNNNLMGQIPPELMNLTWLSALILDNNNFSSLPMINNASSLSFLHLSNNQIVSEFPLLQKNWTNLITLDLGENNFFGKIPSWIGSSFPFLKILRLRSNQFDGSIPSHLSKLSNLQLLDLSNNNLTGPIPQIYFDMSFMKIRSTSNISYVYGNLTNLYEDKIDVVWKGKDFIFQRTITLLTGIDLSCNSLSGEIPEDLMQLQGLIFLNLSRNQLSGVIPQTIGNLTWLEVLDLSMNIFSGNIPLSISRLTHLAMLNLSHNKLIGQIPLGPQMQLFNASVFSDNDGLCGLPLPNNCSIRNSSNMAPINYGGDHKLEVVWIVCFIIFGFIIGFWIYFGTLFWKASLRYTIFDFVDDLQGKMIKWCYF